MQKFILLPAALIAVCFVCSVSAQRAAKRPAKDTRDTAALKKAPVLPFVNVYLGNTGLSGGEIRKGLFDSASKKGLTLTGTEAGGSIRSFSFMYAERGLFEDSVGNPLVLTDYLTEICEGAQLSAGIQSSIYERTKPGDTAYFNDIRVKLPSGLFARGKLMKFVLTK